MSKEKLAKSVRIFNRKEKARARKEQRTPDLVKRTSHTQETSKPKVDHSAYNFAKIWQDSAEARLKASIEASRKIEQEIPKRRTLSKDEIMVSGSRLWEISQGFSFDDEVKYIRDTEAVDILEKLARDIDSGEISTREDIARQVNLIGPKIGPLGGVSTEIDIASWNVLQTIAANRERIK